jgi:D-tyrosyl-tRNA(Tyr) deacylase
LLQRVSHANVVVAGEEIARIDVGLLVLLGVQRGDKDDQAQRIAERLLHYRVFADQQGRMNQSVQQAGGDILLVPQFTLAADTQKGRRPSFTSAAPRDEGKRLFTAVLKALRGAGLAAPSGQFGADMQVSLCNDGPVTFLLEVPPDS